jgi:cytochrome c556
MEDVERRYVVLWDEFENGSNFAARDAARDLKEAFRAPEIALHSPHARDPEFQRFIADIVATLDGVEKEAAKFTADGAARERSELAARCDACHDRFRTPDD